MNARAGDPPGPPWCPRTHTASASARSGGPGGSALSAWLPWVPAPSCAADSSTTLSCARPPCWLPLDSALRHAALARYCVRQAVVLRSARFPTHPWPRPCFSCCKASRALGASPEGVLASSRSSG